MFWKRRDSRERELERELRDHLDLEAEERRDSGVTDQEATDAARRVGLASRSRDRAARRIAAKSRLIHLSLQ
jgi:hypothetical protein